ncbi:transposase [Coraliomargarita sp. W4R72]
MDTLVHFYKIDIFASSIFNLSMPNEFLDQFEAIEKHGSNLPHWQQSECLQFVTFRLNDSIPQVKLKEWVLTRRDWLRSHPEPWNDATRIEYNIQFSQTFEAWLDKGHGSCLLKDANCREHLSSVLMRDHPERAVFESYVIMPNHVHLLFKPKTPLELLIKTWKGVSARKIQHGSIWQSNYRDTLIRNTKHFEAVVRYIRKNPKNLSSHTFTLWESDRAQAIR